MKKLGHCTALPGWQWGGMSRAPFSVPPPCNQFRTLSTFCLLLPFQCRQARAQYPKAPHQAGLRGPGSISSRLAPLHTCTNVFVLHLVMPPHLVPCSVMPYFFFSAPPHLTATFLGCVGGSKPCFRALQGLPSEGMTPLSSPPYPSCTSPVAKPCLSLVFPFPGTTFHFFVLPFGTAPPPLWPPLLSSVTVSSLF